MLVSAVPPFLLRAPDNPGGVPVEVFDVGGKASAARIKGARLKVYPGAPHGITDTHKEELTADLYAFLSDRSTA